MRIFPFAEILIFTAVNNWVIPIIIYASKFGLFKKRPAKFTGCNWWGVVMDVIIAGLINLVILNYLLTTSSKFMAENVLAAFILGLASTIAIHIFMALTHRKEWIMPRPWKWNEGGYWHMISMTLQISYCFYPLVLFYREPKLLELFLTQATILLIVVLGAFFLLALSLKDRDLKIGPLKIRAKTW